jgi:DNA-binding NtrC family response regulator
MACRIGAPFSYIRPRPGTPISTCREGALKVRSGGVNKARGAIRRACKAASGSKAETARLLQLSPRTLRWKLAQLRLKL